MDYYDRCTQFRNGNRIDLVPYIEIAKQNTDIYIVFDKSMMRLDNLSYQYYNDPNYGWLILQANPQLPSMEFSIPDKTVLRIPYPIDSALIRYEESISKVKNNEN